MIDALNAREWRDRILRIALARTVEFARVFMPMTNEGPSPFYLIKNDSGRYVGAVLDMDYDLYDLHVFVKLEGGVVTKSKNLLNEALTDTAIHYSIRLDGSTWNARFQIPRPGATTTKRGDDEHSKS